MEQLESSTTTNNSLEAIHCKDGFDERWDAKFGEPRDEVFTVDGFFKWFDEVMKFN